MALIRFTAIPNPDLNAEASRYLYVESQSVITIERGRWALTKESSLDEQRVLTQRLWEEVERVNGELSAMTKNVAPQDQEEADRMNHWVRMKDAAASLSSAYTMVSRVWDKQSSHPRIECTVLCLSCGTALEHGVMLARVPVMETPDEVAQKIHSLRAAQ